MRTACLWKNKREYADDIPDDEEQGKGQFLGVTLATGMNGNNTCWVEGEARMYIDDDIYPSVHYTGTEDYFTGSYGFGKDI